MNKTHICSFLQKYLLSTSYVPYILLGTEKQIFFFPRGAHVPCLPIGEGGTKSSGHMAELEKENQETVEL